ncbi:GLK1 [Candida oxycetoniae]|uniref:Phosphotransferase n=1 Tax=Candida oxycetoniae TaxID=497107 RepID=A0AAI9WZ92_9ASCO|nr:GLK1 [Candida oxycetoniae]KAI3405948.1 GLK1 [Candida oxycetoniae]
MGLSEKLEVAVRDIENQFYLDDDFLIKASDFFEKSMKQGLAASKPSKECMPMIPTYVTSLPTGKEKGLYLAADLGGTNFRVCSVDLKGDHTFDLKQSKYKIPSELMHGKKADELFHYLATKINDFLCEHHQETTQKNGKTLKLGFTFSFPVEQTALDKGTLLRWTKSFDIPDTVGRDVVQLLQANLTVLEANVKVVALANDTVGTLLSRAYANNPEYTHANTVIGLILGTGTNGAYYATIDDIPKLKGVPEGTKGMVINTEWGSFDNTLEILPDTIFDQIVDSETTNKGYHMFEKRVSGLFLGEILRVALLDMFEKGLIFQDLYKARGGSLPHRLVEPWLLDSEVLSYIQIDDSTNLKMSELILQNTLRLPTNEDERIVIQRLTRAISKRASQLAAIPIASIVRVVKEQWKGDNRDLEIGCDGSVIEFYPGFRDAIMKSFNVIDPLKGSNKKVHLKIAKDGSGVGAALVAATTE